MPLEMRVVLIGGGGHARVVLDAARAQGHEVVAVLDADPVRRGQTLDGVPIVGDEADLPRLRAVGAEGVVLGVGSVTAASPRADLFARIVATGIALPTVQHPSAVVASAVSIGEASVLFANVVVNPGSRIGRNVILNTAAVVDHDCVIGDHVHISPGVRLAGGVTVGSGSHVGIGAVVIQGIRIGVDAFIAAGAVVVQDVADGARVAGVPARPLPQR
jgi:sugar O-acyltransferase (sialic acid O-acetyltransferase NeuD family)